MKIRCDHFGTFLFIALLLAPPAFSQAPEPGEKWRVKTTMSMTGMNMPSQTQTMCQAKAQDTTTAPVPTEKGCRISDAKKVGGKTSMKLTCTGEHPMTAILETEYFGPDRYKGSMQTHVDASLVGPGGPPGGADMTINYEGENLHIACDAGELKRQAAAAQAQSDVAPAKARQEPAPNALQKSKEKFKELLGH